MLRVHVPDSYAAERAYVVDTLLRDFLGLEYELVTGAQQHVRVTADGERFVEVADGLFALPRPDWLSRKSLPVAPFPSVDVADLPHRPDVEDPLVPVLYPATGWVGPVIEWDGNRIRLGHDLFGSAFFLLTRYEELAVDERDARDRFLSSASVVGREGLVSRPLVNEYLEILWAALKSLWPGLVRRRRSYRLVLSHDVDHPFTPRNGIGPLFRDVAWEVWRNRRPLFAARRVLSYRYGSRGVHPRDPWNTFDFIVETERRFGLSSAFYFLTRRSPAPVDADYALEDPWIRRLLERLATADHEIGLHASYDSYLSSSTTLEEAESLRAVCQKLGIEQQGWGGRQHYLRFRAPQTWRNWAEAHMDYDSTLGFVDQAGFRCGTCYEFPVFDLEARKVLSLRERPLVAMDTTLLDYMALDDAGALQTVESLAASCRRYRGDFTLLWHNDRLATRSARRLFERSLAACV